MWFWFGLGGIILNGIALFNIYQKITIIGLSPVVKELISYYERLFYPVADFLKYFINKIFFFVELPDIPNDFIVIYILIGAALLRYLYVPQAIWVDMYHDRFQSSRRVLKIKHLLGLLPTLLIWPGYILLLVYKLKDGRSALSDIRTFLKEWGLQLLKIIVAFVLIFAVNHVAI